MANSIPNIESAESTILNKTSEIWNIFTALEQSHPSDIDDLCVAIHDIQKIVAMRAIRRAMPDTFTTIK